MLQMRSLFLRKLIIILPLSKKLILNSSKNMGDSSINTKKTNVALYINDVETLNR